MTGANNGLNSVTKVNLVLVASLRMLVSGRYLALALTSRRLDTS